MHIQGGSCIFMAAVEYAMYDTGYSVIVSHLISGRTDITLAMTTSTCPQASQRLRDIVSNSLYMTYTLTCLGTSSCCLCKCDISLAADQV